MNSDSSLAILYDDEWLIAIDKPTGLLVHRTALSSDRIVLLQQVRNLLGHHVYPVHRLDRPTSGIVLFAKQPDTAGRLQQQFTQNTIIKTYIAVVRGWTDETGLIDHPLAESKDHTLQNAQTEFKTTHWFELPIANSRFSTSRYSIVTIHPKTGRYHQIRKHMAHISHPVLGDVRHGSGEHNRIFRNHLGIHSLMLRASHLRLTHPERNEELNITAPLNGDFRAIFRVAENPSGKEISTAI